MGVMWVIQLTWHIHICVHASSTYGIHDSHNTHRYHPFITPIDIMYIRGHNNIGHTDSSTQDMTRSCVHDSFIRVYMWHWLFHADMTHSYMCTCLIHTRVHDSFIHMYMWHWLIHADMPHSYIHTCAMTHSYVTHSYVTHSYVTHCQTSAPILHVMSISMPSSSMYLCPCLASRASARRQGRTREESSARTRKRDRAREREGTRAREHAYARAHAKEREFV